MCSYTKLTWADKFRPQFLEKRRMGLSYFLKSVSSSLPSIGCHTVELMRPSCVMLNPEFAGSPILKEFIFSHSTWLLLRHHRWTDWGTMAESCTIAEPWMLSGIEAIRPSRKSCPWRALNNSRFHRMITWARRSSVSTCRGNGVSNQKGPQGLSYKHGAYASIHWMGLHNTIRMQSHWWLCKIYFVLLYLLFPWA